MVGIVLGEVRVEPDLSYTLMIDGDEIFDYGKISHLLVENRKSFEAGFEDVEAVSIGNILEVAQSHNNVLDVDFGIVGGRT